MPSLTLNPATVGEPPHVRLSRAPILAALCVCAGIAPLAARSIGDDVLRVAYGSALAAVFLAFAVYARRTSTLSNYAAVSFAFFIFALVQALNNSIPGFVGTIVLRDPPTTGNPLASTTSGTVTIQLVEMLLVVAPVVFLTKVWGENLSSIYARVGVVGRWLVFAVVFFVGFFLFSAFIPLPRLFPTNGPMSLTRFLALSPALIVLVLSNGLEEELLFRGLFLQKFSRLFGARVANLVQALVFAFAHVGVTYTPVGLLFLVLIVFPLGLAGGYLMRATAGLLVPSLIHGALDLAIYLVFLSYVA